MRIPQAGPEAFEAANVALYPIGERLKQLTEDLNCLPDITNSEVRDHAAYVRRRSVEDELRNAFASKRLNIELGNGFMLQWRQCAGLKGFRLDFAFSQIVVPRDVIGHFRRQPAFLATTEVDLWLTKFTPVTDGTVQHTHQAPV